LQGTLQIDTSAGSLRLPPERPHPSSANARSTMRANRSTSRTEVRFRRALWAAGARGYRCSLKLPGRPDVAFPAIRLAVFVHGCFWHGCPECRLPRPKANAEFWQQKFERNAERDRAVEATLVAAGWKVITVWEHELRADLDGSARRLAQRVTEERGRCQRVVGSNFGCWTR